MGVLGRCCGTQRVLAFQYLFTAQCMSYTLLYVTSLSEFEGQAVPSVIFHACSRTS